MMKDKDPIRKIEDTVATAFGASGVKSVLVAVSGGADSVALLCACVRVAPRLGLHVEAVNCNFHLRSQESDRDSDFTADLCRRLEVKLHRIDYDVNAYLNRHPGVSTEMACRELRYADFFRICSECSLQRVAVAHNSDDDIETMMLAMLRGSGSRGLRGMVADNGRVLRPLLGIARSEIERYLSAIGQDFIIDSSNLTSDYRRNFIRRDVLPLLESRWPGARKSLSRTLSIMKVEAEIIEAHYSRRLAELTPVPGVLLVYSYGVTSGIVLRFIEPFGGNPAIAHAIMESLNKRYNERHWKLSERYTAVLERDRLLVVDEKAQSKEPSLVWERLEMTPKLMAEIKQNRSHDIIYLPHGQTDYELRRPTTGDRMAPLGMKGTRLVSDIISDGRLDSLRKDTVRVLVRSSDGEVIWVPGLKRSRHELVSPNEKWIYRCIWSLG